MRPMDETRCFRTQRWSITGMKLVRFRLLAPLRPCNDRPTGSIRHHVLLSFTAAKGIFGVQASRSVSDLAGAPQRRDVTVSDVSERGAFVGRRGDLIR